MYDPAQVPGFTRLATPEDEARQHPWLAHQLARRVYRATDNEKRLRRLKAVYYGLMSRVDAELGRLIRFLKESGRWDSTLIIFTSDHGEQIGDHWLIGKCGYFDGSYHIPLIIRDPRAQADAERGAIVSSFTENVDIMPTMLEAIGAEIPLQCDGASLAPFLEGAGRPGKWRDRSALGVRLPRSRRRLGRARARTHDASMHDEHRPRRALQVRPLHKSAAALFRSAKRIPTSSPTSQATPRTRRRSSSTRKSSCHGA